MGDDRARYSRRTVQVLTQLHGDRAVYITTAAEYDGSLSGARMREAVSWGKINKMGTYNTVEGDATVILPIMLAAIKDKLDI